MEFLLAFTVREFPYTVTANEIFAKHSLFETNVCEFFWPMVWSWA